MLRVAGSHMRLLQVLHQAHAVRLVLLVTALVGPACRSDDATRPDYYAEQQEVEKTVTHSSRAPAALAELRRRDEIFDQAARSKADFRAKLATLNADYNATPEQFSRLMAEYRAARQQTQRDILEASARLKRTVSPQEWKDLVAEESHTIRLELQRVIGEPVED